MSSYLARFSAFVPAIVSAEAGDLVTANLRALDSHEHAAEVAGQTHLSAGDDFWSEDNWRSLYRPYVVKNGLLLIPVKGVLLHDFPYQFGSFATGYDYIWKAFERGLNDFTVQGIALIVDSPGGEVAGNFDLVDRMYALRAKKPIRAFAAEHAYSAAYSIASVARKIIVSRTGGVGSIGVVTSHVDISKALEDFGEKITFIFAGKHKVDGNPYEPLPEAVKKRIQARIDTLYGVFVDTVARNRGLESQQIRATEALTYSAEDAIEVGLADGIGALDEALAAFQVDLETDQGDEDMTAATETKIDQATVDAARAEGVQAGEAAGVKTGTSAERARFAAILALPEAAKRRDAATSMALETDMTVDQVKKVLATLPETVEAKTETEPKKPAAKTPFEAAMDKTGNPDVGAGDDKGGNDETDVLARILGNHRAMTGAEKRKTV